EDALRQGDPGGAMERQADAIGAMRDGMRQLGKALRGEQGEGEDGTQGSEGQPQDGEQGGSAGRSLVAPAPRGPATDPLGRAL
ncbi:DUF4175 family protein, partial [Streptomyces sp. P9(2023)]|uniref:DUF4175 family protein n=1 Tax=Streptomyces sp. P9(2023) TaxID=3064394 RepID=UPI0028F3EC67